MIYNRSFPDSHDHDDNTQQHGAESAQKIIFIVDDNPTNLTVAESALDDSYLVITMSSAARMFTILKKIVPDLILLDIVMPDMDGFEAIKLLKANEFYSEIPVIFLTALSETETEAKGIELGAVDFISKPFSVPVLLNRVKYHLNIDGLIRTRTDQIRERTDQLMRLQDSIVYTLAEIVEQRDANTGGHIERTTVYIKLLIDAMIKRGIYADELRAWDMNSAVSSTRLHDLGKIAIPDSILNKPDKLTPEEFDIIKTHSLSGEQTIDHMIKRTGGADFLNYARSFAAYHHEKWNGAGYPYRLKGEKIPLQGRIMAIVDVYDALTSERPYKKAFTSDEAIEMIRKDAGVQFDPVIAEVFCDLKDELEKARLKITH